jgi:hypothetical protein
MFFHQIMSHATCVCACVCAYTCLNMCTHVFIRMHVYISMHRNVCKNDCVYAYACVCMYEWMNEWMCVCVISIFKPVDTFTEPGLKCAVAVHLKAVPSSFPTFWMNKWQTRDTVKFEQY